MFPTLLSPIFSFFLGLKTKVAFENVDTGQCHPEQHASDLTSKGTAEASPLLAFLSGTLLNGLNPSSTSSSPFLSRPWITAGGRLRTTFSCRKAKNQHAMETSPNLVEEVGRMDLQPASEFPPYSFAAPHNYNSTFSTQQKIKQTTFNGFSSFPLAMNCPRTSFALCTFEQSGVKLDLVRGGNSF